MKKSTRVKQPGPNQRMRRVNKILRTAVAEECRNLKDPRIGFLTVTGVRTAPDLRNATVYYSVLGDDDMQQRTSEALEAASNRIRAAVGTRVRLKYLPHFQFAVDPSIEHGERIDRILQSLRHPDVSDDAS